jgi:hypothetical protein
MFLDAVLTSPEVVLYQAPFMRSVQSFFENTAHVYLFRAISLFAMQKKGL